MVKNIIIFVLAVIVCYFIYVFVSQNTNNDSKESGDVVQTQVDDLKSSASKKESCDKADHLKWHGLNEANIRPHLMSESIETNIEYYKDNIDLIPTGVDAQGGDVLESDREEFLERYEKTLEDANIIYEEYLYHKDICEE